MSARYYLDDNMPSASELADEQEPIRELGHDWRAIERGGLMRDWDDWRNAGAFAECNNCGQITSEPREVTERCPA